MFHFIETFRAPLIDGVLPSIQQLGLSALLALGSTLIGWYVFTRLSSQFTYRT